MNSKSALQPGHQPAQNIQTEDTSALPADIVSLLVDYFEGDATMLATLSLVSRQWLHTSRSRLFRTFLIRIGVPGSENKWTMSGVVDNLEPHLATYVRDLVLERSEPRNFKLNVFMVLYDDASTWSWRAPDVDITLLVALLAKFPALQSLTIVGCTIRVPLDAPLPLDPAFHLHNLTLLDVHGEPPALEAFLSRISVSGSLCILGTEVHPIDVLGSTAGRYAYKLHHSLSKIPSLTVEARSGCQDNPFTISFFRHFLTEAQTLSYLDAGSLLSKDPVRDCVLQSITDRGKNLRHLRLDLASTRYTTHALDSLVLAECCPRLEILQLRVQQSLGEASTHAGATRPSLYQFDDAVRFLTTASPTLRTVIIGLVSFYWEDDWDDPRLLLDSVDFEAADAALQRFPRLQTVKFQSEQSQSTYTFGDVMSAIATPLQSWFRDGCAERLPRTMTRGVLKFLGENGAHTLAGPATETR